MPGTYLGFPFDEELFLLQWQNAVDPVKAALIASGAIRQSAEIRRLISTGGNLYTIPFYDVLGGDEENYDGQTDSTPGVTSGGSQTGVVYGRMKSWKAQDFVFDFNSGADPMQQITSQVAKYWQKKSQATLISILNGIFGITDDSTDAWDAWQLHTNRIASDTTSVGAANSVGETTAGDTAQQACGDNAGIFSLAVMHSKVANTLAAKQLLQFRKYTDPAGIERTLNIADWNGYTVLVDDGVPVTTGGTSKAKEYTTYLFGNGAILTASAPVKNAAEVGRDRLTDGGFDYLVTRKRETYHPNGFSFVLPSSTVSPTNVQLGTAANWKLAGVDPKAISIARIISNG